jgi:hypothetical protein
MTVGETHMVYVLVLVAKNLVSDTRNRRKSSLSHKKIKIGRACAC